MALVLKRKNNSDEITAFDDAALIYSSIGDGILEKVFNGMTCSVNSSTKKITISSGVLLFGGRMVVIESGTTYELDVTSLWSGSGQISVICEMTIAEDDEDSSVTIYASKSTSETTTSPLLPGVHRKKIFQFYPANVNTARYPCGFISPGVAKSALNISKDGMIGSVKFTDIFLDNLSGVRYARESDVAAEATGFVGGSINKVEENLYMPNRGVYLLQRLVLVESTESFTIENGKTKEFSFKYASKINLSGIKFIQYVACDGSHNIGFPSTSSSDVYLGVIGSSGELANKYNNLTIKISGSGTSGKVTLSNNSGSNITLSGFKLNTYAYGGK